MFNKRQTAAHCRSIEAKALGITGARVKVLPVSGNTAGIPPDTIGCTDRNRIIHLGYSNEMVNELSVEETASFFNGVGLHEIMHLLMTDFGLAKKYRDQHPTSEQQIFHNIFNVLEDSAIEYFAPQYAGGRILEDLNFMRAFIYKQSESIDSEDNSRHAFYQYMTAAIQFGDAGLIKGEFTLPEAYNAFMDTIELWAKGVKEPDAEKRIQISEEIFQKTKPLWEEMAKNAKEMEEFLKELQEALKQQGKDGAESEGGGLGKTPSADGMPESEREKRRKITIHRITKEEAEEMGLDNDGENESGGVPPDGDIDLYIVEGEEAVDKPEKSDGIPIPVPAEKAEDDEKAEAEDVSGSDDKTDVEEDDAPEIPEDGDPEDKTETESGSSGTSTDTDSESADSMGDTSKGESGSPSNMDADYSHEGEIPSDSGTTARSIEEEFEISDERYHELAEELAKYSADLAAEASSDKDEDSVVIDVPLSTDGINHICKGKTVRNLNVKMADDTYNALLTQYQKLVGEINDKVLTLSNQFKRLFERAKEEKMYRTSGRLDAQRLGGSRLTCRVFEKNRNAGDRSDTAVFLLVDESGSMRGEKASQARIAAIGLAETFAKNKIPLYVMGFTADTDGAHAVHFHYLKWRNTLKDRVKLLNISGRDNNFDGYSIRQAYEILKKRPEEHKLLIVISDGEPACRSYGIGKLGIADTKLAVKEASKYATVIGVLVGTLRPDIHKELYGFNFLHVTNANMLFTQMGSYVRKLIKGW
jgi:cobalamin biosynthesis protein CobT